MAVSHREIKTQLATDHNEYDMAMSVLRHLTKCNKVSAALLPYISFNDPAVVGLGRRYHAAWSPPYRGRSNPA